MAALEAVLGDGRIEHPDLGDAGQAAPGEGEQGERLGGALLGRGGRQVLVGDPLIEAAGESLGFLRAGGGADRVEPVNAWCQRRCHGSCPRPCGGGWMVRLSVTV